MRLLILALVAAGIWAQQEIPGQVFRTTVNMVVAPVTVEDGDRAYVHGLQPHEFRLTDNGAIQNIKVDVSYIPISLVVAVQANVDTEAVRPKIQKIHSMLAPLVAGDQGEIAVVAFDHRIDVLQDFTTDADLIARAFEKIGKAANFLKSAWDAGFIQAILGGIVAFKAATIAIAAISAVLKIFNITLAANPVMAIVLGLALLTAAVIWAIKNWDHITAAVGRAWSAIRDFATGLWTKVVGAFRAVRDAIFALLDNPFIKAAGLIFLPFITIPLLIAKHWDTVRATIASVIEWVLGAVQKISSAGKWVAGIFGGGGGAATGPVSPNAGMIESRSIEESRSTLDLNINNLPAGSTVKQTGRAPGFTLNTGFAFGGR